MRNLWNGIVNWVAALFAAYGGAPHPMVATDDVPGPGLADPTDPASRDPRDRRRRPRR
ncbi:MAG TPA: hypothetical protein VFM87_10555 [Agrococcus sp.]|jgi:hypothetical protein|nr:hypothetical protein [Agrococcus sp.]